MKSLIISLFTFVFLNPIQAQNIVWDPANSTYDSKPFVQLQPGIGALSNVELTGSDEGFFKLNTPTDQPYDDPNFDIDGNNQPDPIWRYRISNTTWSQQALTFGKINNASASESNTRQIYTITP